MSLTPSTMLDLGTKAPEFSLSEPGGKTWSISDFQKDSSLLVIFMCNHCPYVVHIREALSDFAKEYQKKGLAIVGINSNDVDNYPEDAPDKMQKEKQSIGYPFPYLFDETQEVAKRYHAACTPDFFLFNENKELVYRGQFDDSRPGNSLPVTGQDLRNAIEKAFKGEQPDPDQKPSIGCNIKWRPGNEPDYFLS